MGNCIESCRRVNNEGGGKEEEREKNRGDQNRGITMEDGKGQILKEDIVGVKKSNKINNGKRVKMVLTKEELQWLMQQLRNREAVGNESNCENNCKRLEDVLIEIEKGRKRLLAPQCWKPSLHSISELPELQEMHT